MAFEARLDQIDREEQSIGREVDSALSGFSFGADFTPASPFVSDVVVETLPTPSKAQNVVPQPEHVAEPEEKVLQQPPREAEPHPTSHPIEPEPAVVRTPLPRLSKERATETELEAFLSMGTDQLLQSMALEEQLLENPPEPEQEPYDGSLSLLRTPVTVVADRSELRDTPPAGLADEEEDDVDEELLRRIDDLMHDLAEKYHECNLTNEEVRDRLPRDRHPSEELVGVLEAELRYCDDRLRCVRAIQQRESMVQRWAELHHEDPTSHSGLQGLQRIQKHSLMTYALIINWQKEHRELFTMGGVRVQPILDEIIQRDAEELAALEGAPKRSRTSPKQRPRWQGFFIPRHDRTKDYSLLRYYDKYVEPYEFERGLRQTGNLRGIVKRAESPATELIERRRTEAAKEILTPVCTVAKSHVRSSKKRSGRTPKKTTKRSMQRTPSSKSARSIYNPYEEDENHLTGPVHHDWGKTLRSSHISDVPRSSKEARLRNRRQEVIEDTPPAGTIAAKLAEKKVIESRGVGMSLSSSVGAPSPRPVERAVRRYKARHERDEMQSPSRKSASQFNLPSDTFDHTHSLYPEEVGSPSTVTLMRAAATASSEAHTTTGDGAFVSTFVDAQTDSTIERIKLLKAMMNQD